MSPVWYAPTAGSLELGSLVGLSEDAVPVRHEFLRSPGDVHYPQDIIARTNMNA